MNRSAKTTWTIKREQERVREYLREREREAETESEIKSYKTPRVKMAPTDG